SGDVRVRLRVFADVYALFMVLMAGFGVVLSQRIRGSRAIMLLGEEPQELVSQGQVQRSDAESLLARLYAFGLVLGLVLFYVAVPFILAGLLMATGLMLYWI